MRRETEVVSRAISIILKVCLPRFVTCVAILILFTSCKVHSRIPERTVKIGDGGFLSETPCGPPCFWGITPGETTETEVMAILQDRGVIESCESFDKTTEGGFRGIKCGLQMFIMFERESHLVYMVGFSPARITVRDVIEKYGEPAGVEVGAVGIHNYDAQLIMSYPDMFALVRLPIQDDYPYSLEPSTPVEDILYSLVYGPEHPVLQDEWRGYGKY